MNLLLNDYKRIRTPFAFLDETGNINDISNRFFCLGMIKCMQPFYLDTKIRQIRQKYYFFDEIKWNTLSKAKINAVKEIIEATFNTPGIYFSSLVINKDDVNFGKDFKNNPYFAYQIFAETLLKQSVERNEVVTVLADFVATPKNIRFEIDVKHSVNQSLKRLAIGGIHRVDSKGVNLIQIVDLFIGAVVYDYKMDLQLVSGDKNKINILKLLLKKLNRKSFVGGIRMKRFTVLEYKKGPSS